MFVNLEHLNFGFVFFSPSYLMQHAHHLDKEILNKLEWFKITNNYLNVFVGFSYRWKQSKEIEDVLWQTLMEHKRMWLYLWCQESLALSRLVMVVPNNSIQASLLQTTKTFRTSYSICFCKHDKQTKKKLENLFLHDLHNSRSY
jgi:dipeptidase